MNHYENLLYAELEVSKKLNPEAHRTTATSTVPMLTQTWGLSAETIKGSAIAAIKLQPFYGETE